MPQKHLSQEGTFHVTTNAKGRMPWCTLPGVPEILIDNLCMTRSVHRAELFAFCVLPDHVHMVIRPGERGLSRFVQSFKSHAMVEIRSLFTNVNPVAASHGSLLRLRVRDILWQKGYHDEHIQDDDQLHAALAYVRANACRHGLSETPEDWPWTSLHFGDRLDVWSPWFD